MIIALQGKRDIMGKLVFGKNGQVHFNNENEKHEDNQEQGAWVPEERIHFKSEDGVPDCLKRLMTAGRPGLYGRINCKEFCEELRKEAKRREQ